MEDPLHRIEMIDTEIMLLGQLWQSGQDTYRDGHSVILQKTIALLQEREECEGVLGREVGETRCAGRTASASAARHGITRATVSTSEKIDWSTPCRRRSPNAVYVDDVLVGTVREDGQPFKGRVAEVSGRTVVLENGYGGRQWVDRSSLRTEP